MSIQPNGGAINFVGNMGQNVESFGLPKGMIFVLANGTISRCYNAVTGATSGGCGYTVTMPFSNSYVVNFGFNLSSRFYSLTSSSTALPGGIAALAGRLGYDPANPNAIAASFWRTNDVAGIPSDFTLIVY